MRAQIFTEGKYAESYAADVLRGKYSGIDGGDEDEDIFVQRMQGKLLLPERTYTTPTKVQGWFTQGTVLEPFRM